MHDFVHHANNRNIRLKMMMYAQSCIHMSAKREFNKALFTLCPPYVMFPSVWNLRSVTGGLPGHLILCVLQGRWEEKEHNWIRYQNRVSVCFNQSGDTGSSWKHRVKRAWRERKREKEEGRESKRRQIVKEKEKRKKERQRGQPGDWSLGYGWIMETWGWRGSCLGGGWPFGVQCQVSKPIGQWSLPLSQHLTNMRCSRFISTQHQQIIRPRTPLKKRASVKLMIYLFMGI